jgi:signal transduction histidine kinase
VNAEISIPYAEFSEAGALVGSLQGEVERLREAVASEAHTKGQASVIRGIGHDLKTPLSQFRKFFEVLLLKHQRTGELDGVAVSRIKESCERMGSLLREMRRMGKVWGLGDEPRHIDVAAEANAYLDSLEAEPDFPTKGIAIKRSLYAGRSFANISPTQFYRIFDNLMKNALDATPFGGLIVVALVYRDGRPFLIVGDDGEGIPKEDLPKIFSPDFTTKTTRGTGLGLAIVREICSEVGAQVVAENAPEKGAIFSIHFQGGFKKSVQSESFRQDAKL